MLLCKTRHMRLLLVTAAWSRTRVVLRGSIKHELTMYVDIKIAVFCEQLVWRTRCYCNPLLNKHNGKSWIVMLSQTRPDQTRHLFVFFQQNKYIVHTHYTNYYKMLSSLTWCKFTQRRMKTSYERCFSPKPEKTARSCVCRLSIVVGLGMTI